MKVAIVGMPKTGTTALYNTLKTTLGSKTFSIFEPKTVVETQGALGIPRDNVLIKFMLGKLDSTGFVAEDFDKVVLIVRDPRDFFISAMLYRFNSPGISTDEKRYNKLVSQFSKKEQDPGSISCLELLECFGEGAATKLKNSLVQQFDRMIDIAGEEKIFVYKYEDMIDRKFERLSEFLGVKVKTADQADGWTSKIARTKGYGDWKNWMTEADLSEFRQTMNSFMTNFGYKEESIGGSNPVIDSKNCTAYIEKLRKSNEVDPMHSPAAVTSDYLRNLESAIGDGKSLAMVKMALYKLAGKDVELDKEGAAKLLRLASRLGNARAMREVGKTFLASGDVKRAINWFRRAVKAGDNESLLLLAKIFRSDEYGRKDIAKAKRLANRARRKGVTRSVQFLKSLKDEFVGKY